ncbi:MAG: gamma-glutamyltransferase [Candidatus Marinimicrobia bacterium]|nr:gamma-glutamyltransferase [Candidatus Neomarinimicrobiota bacterium]
MKSVFFKIIILFFLQISTIICRFPDAVGLNGMVVSSNNLATQAGVDILNNGGNAIDAAIAVGFTLAVTHPGAGNIGGGGFMVIRFSDGTSTSIDFRETAPGLSTKNMFLDENGDVIPGMSWSTAYASGVPGTVAGFGYAHAKYGKLRWPSLLKSSIDLAKFGHKIDYLNFSLLNNEYYREYLANDVETKKIFYKEDGFTLDEIFIQKDLASTLSRIANRGYEEFYTGETAKNIIRCMDRTGGLISESDLKNYSPVERKPVEFLYRKHKIITMPPSSSGGIVLAEIMNQLENLDMDSIEYHSSQHIHYMSEIEKIAYADRAEALGDMDFIKIPLKRMISDEYARKQFDKIDCCSANDSNEINPISIDVNEKEETTHYSVIDKWGNSVSVTTTINGWYGSGITVDGSGFLLNNEMDDFSSKPGYPNKYGLIGSWANSIEPNKRMLSSMTPTIIEDVDGDVFLIVGSPGGSTIITTVAQIISNVIDFNMPLKDAIEAPRTHHQWIPNNIFIESNSFNSNLINELNKMGHIIAEKRTIGEANCIMYDKKSKVYLGVADSRRNGSAIGY